MFNLANDPKFREDLLRHRKFLSDWVQETGDQGQRVESNIGLLATMKRWGNLCVNPEYDRVRPQYEKWKVEQAKKEKPLKGKTVLEKAKKISA